MVDTFNALGILALAMIAGFLYFVHLSNRIAVDVTVDDTEADDAYIPVGDALFTAEEYARLLDLYNAYQSYEESAP